MIHPLQAIKSSLLMLFMTFAFMNYYGQTVDAGIDRSICLGDSVLLSAGAATSYLWTPATGLSNTDIANPYAFPSETTTYTLSSTDLDGNESVDTITIFVVTTLNVSAGNDQIICAGETVVLGEAPLLDVSYNWSPDLDIDNITLANPTVTPQETTTYTVMAQNGSCTSSDEVTISVQSILVDFDYLLFPSCESIEIQLVNKSDDVAFQWNFWDGSSTTERSPLVSIDQPQSIFITLRETVSSCNFNKTVAINLDDMDSYINFSATNVFTPNGDGINDYMDIGITGNLSDCMEFNIFNRWGERVFVSQGGNTHWDGRTLAGELVAPGTYFYSAQIKGVDHRGTVQVIY